MVNDHTLNYADNKRCFQVRSSPPMMFFEGTLLQVALLSVRHVSVMIYETRDCPSVTRRFKFCLSAV